MAIQIGTKGAKVQSWKSANPREMLVRMMDESPGTSRETLLEEFRGEVRKRGNDSYLDVIIDYWFANNFYSLTADRPERKAEARAQKADQVETIKTKLKAKIVEEARVILLDLMMPNGRRLAECTGAECGRMSKRVGTWLSNIAGAVRPSEVVGDVLDEAAVRRFYGRPEKSMGS